MCLTFGTFICTTCSGLHREFSHKVKAAGTVLGGLMLWGVSWDGGWLVVLVGGTEHLEETFGYSLEV